MSKKIFTVNNALYPENIIQDAAIAFAGYSIEVSPNQIIIDDEDPQFVFDELMNYTISLSLEKFSGA